jgi:hypothetical protein
MSVWLCIPSKRLPEEAEKVLKLWRERGYKIALWRDEPFQGWGGVCDEFFDSPRYPGYACVCNSLIAVVSKTYRDAEWFVTGGDDVEPDANHSAEEIARHCQGFFTKLHYGNEAHHAADLGPLSTFGVMQPTGDRWGDKQGAYIDRVCGSPWLGREFCRRMYQGDGPYFPGYTHMGVDEELQAVAIKLGVLWQCPDLIHLHRHWGRGPDQNPNHLVNRATMPEFLKKVNTREHWDAYKKLFAERQAAGFPGHEPI